MSLKQWGEAAMGAVIGAPMQIALEKALELVEPVFYYKKWAKDLEETALSLKPDIDKYVEIAPDPDLSTPRYQRYRNFQGLLESAIGRARQAEEINMLEKFNYAEEIHEFLEKIHEFIRIEGPPNLALDSQKLRVDVGSLGQKLAQVELLSCQNISPTHPNIDGIHGAEAAERSNRINSQVPPKPEKALGLDERINEVKQILNQRDVNIIGITGMGGSGKTTLASALCHDRGVKDTFPNNIHFISVSQFHGNENGVCEILEIMCHSIFGGEKPKFRSIEYGRNQLQNNLNGNAHPKTLVVLDDVWPGLSVENLLFTAEGYKTIITTRHNSIIHYIHGTPYEIPVLNDDDALSLFCFWAFGKDSIPPTANGDLVREVAAECKCLPLALKVVGSSLHRKPLPTWQIAKEKLSKSEPISTEHVAGLVCRLKTSIGILSDKERQCFLDLGAFPEGRKFGVGSLLDIWIYVREMTWLEAFGVLLELASRNLMHLTGYGGRSAAINYHCASELSFSQHDVMRDLALHLSNQDDNIICKRLFMPRKEANIPTEWLSAAQSSSAQFVSIHTGAMKEEDWGQINFPKVEALTLFFDAKQYCLPTFLQNMSNLKVLIVYNYSSQRATLSGLPSFPSSVQIRSVLLYKLIVPSSFYENCRSWERLEKLYICLCGDLGNITPVNEGKESEALNLGNITPVDEGKESEALNFPKLLEIIKLYICLCGDLGNITPVDKDKESEALNFPKLLEINFDHCSELRELPIKLSSITSLQMLSVTNCHLIENLPVDLETLSSLRVLRLSACPSLSRLPPSISKLAQLEYFDISICTSLKDLPAEFDQLPNLKTLDMRECSRLKLPNVKPRSLERVIISEAEKESAEKESRATWSSIFDAVAESFSLDWLDDN